jgi:hypothetical protein
MREAWRTAEELSAGLDRVRASPRDEGRLLMIVRRPLPGRREILDEGRLDPVEGLVGDGWRRRGSRSTPDGSSDPDRQITLMNARCVELLAGGRERWALAGDQLFVDLDLSEESLPPGSRLALGTAVIEVTPPPHTGCKKFVERFGAEALKFVNSPEGRRMRLRGLHGKVVQVGRVRVGDPVRKVAQESS